VSEDQELELLQARLREHLARCRLAFLAHSLDLLGFPPGTVLVAAVLAMILRRALLRLV
jgi:hypothetical protein